VGVDLWMPVLPLGQDFDFGGGVILNGEGTFIFYRLGVVVC
jgi:hypothetical protein